MTASEHPDTSVKKVSAAHAPTGEMGQIYLVSGKRTAIRLWQGEPAGPAKPLNRRDYETVGYVIDGRAELEVEGQGLRLEPGDSWLVPAGAAHRYTILESFTAVEATAPPAQVHGRDTPPASNDR
ncbi:MAG: cupin domain-containing protein [Geminicoccaceae bacterium]|nr:MAG: cupin domain-containing protein [Geminicoccaceae bacterium]